MDRLLRTSIALILIALAALSATREACAQAPGPVEKLLPWVPPDANAVALLRSADIFATTRAKSEDWLKKANPVSCGPGLDLPLDAAAVLKAIEFTPETMSVAQRTGLAYVGKRPDWNAIATRESVPLDQLNSQPLVVLPGRGALLGVSSDILGVVAPLHRQAAARWLREGAKGNGVVCSDYLRTSLMESQAHAVIALDLTDLLDPRRVETWLAGIPSFAGRDADVKTTFGLLRTVRGLTAELNFAETNELKLRLDFDGLVTQNAVPLVHAVLLQVMDDAGAHVPELVDARPTRTSRSLVLQTSLSNESTRALLGLFLTPSSEEVARSIATDAPRTEVSDSDKARQAAQNYYTSVNRFVDDVLGRMARATDYNRTATWHDSAAQSIDHLSLNSVPEELQKYGKQMSNSLRALAASLRGVPIDVEKLAAAYRFDYNYMPTSWNYGIWSWGYHPAYLNISTNEAEIRAKQAEAIANGAKEREQIIQQMQDERQDVRRAVLSSQGFDPETSTSR